MRRFSPLVAVLGLVAVVARLLGSFSRRLGALRDEANIRRLAEHLGCSMEDARRVYRLSRELGYGAAHQEVFGRREVAARRTPAGAPPPDDADVAVEAQTAREPVAGRP